MRNIKRILVLTILFTFLSAFYSYAEGMSPQKFSDDEQVYLYRNDDDTYFTNGWKQVWDSWYYFGEDGLSKQNTWAEIDGNWYYFDNFSRMLHDTTTPDGYYVGSDGAWVQEETSLDTSKWLGYYTADDGQTIAVWSVDTNNVYMLFVGYGEEGWYEQNKVLTYTNAEKTQAAIYNEVSEREVYTLNGNQIEVSVEPSGGWKQGTYVKQ